MTGSLRVTIAIMMAFFSLIPARSQEVVIDPSQIAASAANSAEQIDYLVQQLSELNSLGGKISDIKSYADNMFGENASGITSFLSDLGVMDELAESYSNSISAISEAAKKVQKLQKIGISDISSLLQMIETTKEKAENAVLLSKSVLTQSGFTKAEKKQQIEALCKEMKAQTDDLNESLEIEERISENTLSLCSFLSEVDSEITSPSISKSSSSSSSSLGGFTKILSTLLMLLGIGCLAFGYSSYLKGDSTVFIRIGAGVITGVILLGVLSKIFGI